MLKAPIAVFIFGLAMTFISGEPFVMVATIFISFAGYQINKAAK